MVAPCRSIGGGHDQSGPTIGCPTYIVHSHNLVPYNWEIGMHEYNELNRIEKPAIELFTQLGYAHENAFYDTPGPYSSLGRHSESEVVLVKYLRPALKKINKEILEAMP